MTPAERLAAGLSELHGLLPDRDRDVVGLDLETSGFDPQREEILEMSLARLTPAGAVTTHEQVFRPSRPVSAEILELTGLTREELDAAPSGFDARVARVFAAGVAGCDFFGYNHKYFDLPFLEAACARAGVAFDWAGARLIDAYVLWGKVEKRNLETYVRRFAGRDHAGAHRATADVAGTVDGFCGFLRTFPDAPRTVRGLHDVAFGDEIDRDGKFVWGPGDEPLVNFGAKYKRKPMALVDAGFWEWMLRSEFAADTKRVARDALEGRLPRRGGNG